MIHLLSFPNEPWAVVAFLAVSRKGGGGGGGGGGLEGGCQIGTLGVVLLECPHLRQRPALGVYGSSYFRFFYFYLRV